MEVREHRSELIRRVRLLSMGAVFLLVVIGCNFFVVQLVQGEYYRALAENNRLRELPLEAPRGLIHDRDGRLLAENIPSYQLMVDRSRTEDLARSLAFAAEVLEVPVADLEARIAKAAALPDFQPVVLVEDLPLTRLARFEAKRLEYPEFEVTARQVRLYRHGPHAAHVLGYLGEVSQEEIDAAGGEVYGPGDLVGKKGIEDYYDLRLRGEDGRRMVVVDSRGRMLEERVEAPAEPGKPLTLTLDLELQKTAERALEGRVGAVVAIDPRDGSIRVMVSQPGYNPNLLARRVTSEQWQAIVGAPHHPLQNRSIQNTYSPGSVFKIVVASAGLAEGVISGQSRVYCPGATHIYGRRFRCWKRSGHGWVDLERAMAGSCDIYFYQLGQNLGIERIAEYSRRFGLGRLTGVDLEGEKIGLVPDPAWSLERRGHPWYPGETISVAIGQGPLLTTPLQIATLMAGVANGGRGVVPHLLEGAVREDPAGLDVPLGVLEPVRQALWTVVNGPGGTGGRARLDGFDVAGKTGTVQVVSQSTWISSDSLPYEQRDHAWFAAFAPLDEPELAVAVFVEHGGGGSKAAAPIAKAIYEKYFGIEPAEQP